MQSPSHSDYINAPVASAVILVDENDNLPNSSQNQPLPASTGAGYATAQIVDSAEIYPYVAAETNATATALDPLSKEVGTVTTSSNSSGAPTTTSSSAASTYRPPGPVYQSHQPASNDSRPSGAPPTTGSSAASTYRPPGPVYQSHGSRPIHVQHFGVSPTSNPSPALLEDPIYKRLRRKRRRRARMTMAGMGGFVMGSFIGGPIVGAVIGIAAAKTAKSASKLGERRKDKRVNRQWRQRIQYDRT
jgi:hypothetical protein